MDKAKIVGHLTFSGPYEGVVPLFAGVNRIGKKGGHLADKNYVVVPARSVSGSHCDLECPSTSEGIFRVTDLGSKNKTKILVPGTPLKRQILAVNEPHVVSPGDIFYVGKVKCEISAVEDNEDSGSTTTEDNDETLDPDETVNVDDTVEHFAPTVPIDCGKPSSPAKQSSGEEPLKTDIPEGELGNDLPWKEEPVTKPVAEKTYKSPHGKAAKDKETDNDEKDQFSFAGSVSLNLGSHSPAAVEETTGSTAAMTAVEPAIPRRRKLHSLHSNLLQKKAKKLESSKDPESSVIESNETPVKRASDGDDNDFVPSQVTEEVPVLTSRPRRAKATRTKPVSPEPEASDDDQSTADEAPASPKAKQTAKVVTPTPPLVHRTSRRAKGVANAETEPTKPNARVKKVVSEKRAVKKSATDALSDNKKPEQLEKAVGKRQRTVSASVYDDSEADEEVAPTSRTKRSRRGAKSSAQSKSGPRLSVMLTGCDNDEALKKMIRSLNGIVPNTAAKAHVCVASKAMRTPKFCASIGRIPVVTESWLRDSVRDGSFADTKGYGVKGKSIDRFNNTSVRVDSEAAEEMYKKNGPILEGTRVFVVDKGLPTSIDDLEQIIACMGGELVYDYRKVDEETLILSNVADDESREQAYFRAESYDVFSVELLIVGSLMQKVAKSRYQLNRKGRPEK